MTVRYSLIHELKAHRWYPGRPSNKPVAGWKTTLGYMRHWWERDEDTVLETRFYCELDGNPDPLHRRRL